MRGAFLISAQTKDLIQPVGLSEVPRRSRLTGTLEPHKGDRFPQAVASLYSPRSVWNTPNNGAKEIKNRPPGGAIA